MKKLILAGVLLAVCGSALADKPDTYYTCTRKADNGFIVRNIQYVQSEGERPYVKFGESLQDVSYYRFDSLDDLKQGVYDSSETSTIRIASSKTVPLIVYYKTATDEREYHCEYDAASTSAVWDMWERAHKSRDSKSRAAEKAASARAAALAKASSDVDDLFGDLSNGKNKPAHNAKASQSVSSGLSGADVNQYAMSIRNAIQRHLDVSSYAGKQCDMTLHLNRDGSVKGVDTDSGDAALCSAVNQAVLKVGKFEQPPSDAVYQAIKDSRLDIKF